ncbi:MFS transporter [Oceanihabitans sp. IOP_32]|uniref:MFS transporter n=1 Tax=Oceanihabitans sp. IOP_32 TaxID=2529032 RepID=UPI001292DA2D|nr:MFS transporter [Oceanihabitans sp. IOP_32]QFZ54525.1 MFS transporter [Oceanihabitans sp. IOP_32]
MQQKIKVIQIIHFALCLGLIIAYLFLGDINALTQFNFDSSNTAHIMYILIPVMAYLLSNFLFNSQLKNIDASLKLEEKITFYQSASIMRWAVLEGAAFLILFLNKDFMIFGILIIIYLILIRPTQDNIVMKLS